MSSEKHTIRTVDFDAYFVKGELFFRTEGKFQGSFFFRFV